MPTFDSISIVAKWRVPSLLFGFLLGAAISSEGLRSYVYRFWERFFSTLSSANKRKDAGAGAFWDLVGHTPLVRIKSLSRDLGIEVFGKAEFLNPGGSVKDRVAKAIICAAEKKGFLSEPGDAIYEGTSGSTGISLTMAAKCRGYDSCIYLPDDQAAEKVLSLRVLGATVVQLPPCSIVDPNHYCNASRRDASVTKGSQRRFFADQFENLANFQVHYDETGEEIWSQMEGRVDGFVASAGTGGTISGVGMKLQERNSDVKIILADPQGSALYNKIRYGVVYNDKDAEGHRTRRICDTIVEGVGINRLTLNMRKGLSAVTHSYRVSDMEAVHMSRYLIEHDGLFIGSSSALNCCALVKAVRDGTFPPGSRVVVMLCDSGVRHLSRFYNSDYLLSQQLLPRYLMSSSLQPDVNYDRERKGPVSRSIKAASSNTPPGSVFDFVDE